MAIIDVEKVAHLARLQIDAEAIPALHEQLEQIKTLVEHINSVDTDHIEPMAHPLNQSQRLRDDEVTEQTTRQTLQQMAPLTEAGLYLVPKVIERDDNYE